MLSVIVANARDTIACSSSPNRFLRSDLALPLHLDATPLTPRHAPNGSAPPERPH